jgi:hypothetical protein
VCGVVVEEASRAVEVTGSNHGNRGASQLYGKKYATCCLFRFLSADPENVSAGGRLKRPPALGPYAGGRTPASSETTEGSKANLASEGSILGKAPTYS